MPTIKTIDDEEIQKLIGWIYNPTNYRIGYLYARRNHLLFVLMLDAGLRVGELVQLRRRDLITNEQPVDTIHIQSGITKTHQERNIPATNRIKNSIDLHLIPKCHPTILYPGDYAFPRPRTTQAITTRQVRRIISNAGKAALGRNISPHTLRHTFATRLLRHTSTRIVQQLLGHKCLSSTQIYTHPNSQDLKQAIDKL